MSDTGKESGKVDDSTKARFREALERKNARAQEGEAHEDFLPDVNLDHNLDGRKKTFRRKTG